MDGLLTATSTRKIKRNEADLFAVSGSGKTPAVKNFNIQTSEDVLSILRSQPDTELLSRCLLWLAPKKGVNPAFDIKIPSPNAAQILHALVNDTAPTFWPILRDEATDFAAERKLFLSCLRNVAGIGALATRLQALARASGGLDKASLAPAKTKDHIFIDDTFDLLENTLQGDKFLRRLTTDLFHASVQPLQRSLIWKEIVSWLAGGRILTIAAEAALVNQGIGSDEDGSWVAHGRAYVAWLGRNIRAIQPTSDQHAEEISKSKARLFGRALSLGYKDQLVEAVFESALCGEDGWRYEYSFFKTLMPHERRVVLFTLFNVAANRFKSHETALIKGLGAFIRLFSDNDEALTDSLENWIAGMSGESIAVELIVHRAVIAALSSSPNHLERAVKELLTKFGDKLCIQNTPVLHQEIQTQDLLLLIGHLHKLKENWLRDLARSSLYINAISNRLAASSSRSRFLGMILGTSVSELIDPADRRMTFGAEEMETDDGKWYRSLIRIFDRIGSLEDLKISKESKSLGEHAKIPRAVSVPRKIEPSQSKVVAIEEVEEDSESSDDDIPVYQKPDSDEEDEEEDPTLIQRDKLSPPVYIRELIAGLHDYENFDRHRLALESAADLIRRKANFGTEVSDHIEDLAAQLAGLKDNFNMDNFQEMRIKGMIAVIVARPKEMGKWFSTSLFTGDYSVSQRASILTSLSMAARELAGYREEDVALTGATMAVKDMFPSKRLPDKQEKTWSYEASPVDAIAERMERTMIRPMAAEAADKLTGPNILKVRTFSSRMEVEKKRKRPITNELAKIVSENFFFPLTGRFQIDKQVRGSNSPFQTPFLLSHFLKTLGLILSASGSSTLSLPALTTEFWAFLLHLRAQSLNALPVLEAMLFCFMTIFEINDNDQRQMVTDHSKELLETQAWVQQVIDNARGGEVEGDRIRMLAAGILVKCSEIVEKYQRLMMGELVNYPSAWS